MLKAIFFDAAGTLIHLPQGVGWHYAAVARRHGWAPHEGRLATVFAVEFEKMIAQSVAGSLQHRNDREWWRALVFRVLDGCDCPPGFAREAYFDDLFEHFALPGVWALYPEVPAVLENLGRCFRLAVLSNFDARLRRILVQLGIGQHFEQLFISGELGMEKPAPRIFAHALERMGLEPGEALHVGDHPVHDWQGAETAGLQAFRLDRPRNDLRALLELAT